MFAYYTLFNVSRFQIALDNDENFLYSYMTSYQP